jgi:plastocyanin
MNRLLLLIALFTVGAMQAQPLRFYSVVSLMNGQTDFVTDSNTIVTLPTWGYGWNAGGASVMTVPGPTIYANEGDSVHLEMFNPSMEGHTIHLHGLDVDEANDGVPHHTGFILEGESFTYKFKATHAGNFLYHCHVTTTMHLALGMYGMVIVHPDDSSQTFYTNGPAFDQQREFLLSDLDARWNKDYTKIGGFLTYAPDMFLINGKNKSISYADTANVMHGQVGDQLLMRFLNVGYRVNRVVFPSEVNAVVHTSDGRVLDEAFTTDTLIIYPGERFSVLAEVLDDSPSYVRIDWLDPYRLSYLGCEYIPLNDDDFSYLPYEEDNSLIDSIALSEGRQPEPFFKAYPNPVVEDLVIATDEPLEALEIINLSGERVWRKSLDANTIQVIHLTDIADGAYFIQARTVDGQRLTRKLLKVSGR